MKVEKKTTGVLIKTIAKFPSLYDVNDPSFKDKEANEVIWKRLASTLGITAEALKSRWIGLKVTYIRHLRSLAGCHRYKNGNKTCRSWLWAKQMEFMKPFVEIEFKRGRRLSKVQMRRRSADTSSGTPWSEDDAIVSNLNRSPKRKGSRTRISRVSSRVARDVSSERDVEAIPADPSDLAPRSNTASTTVEAVSDCIRPSTSNPFTELDAIDHLFLSWAKTVKQFSPRRLVFGKKRISDLITSLELEQLEEEESLRYPTKVFGPPAVSARDNRESSVASSWSSRPVTPVDDPLNCPQSSTPTIKSETKSFDHQNGRK